MRRFASGEGCGQLRGTVRSRRVAPSVPHVKLLTRIASVSVSFQLAKSAFSNCCSKLHFPLRTPIFSSHITVILKKSLRRLGVVRRRRKGPLFGHRRPNHGRESWKASRKSCQRAAFSCDSSEYVMLRSNFNFSTLEFRPRTTNLRFFRCRIYCPHLLSAVHFHFLVTRTF